MKYKAEITRRKNGETVDTAKTFNDFDTAICYIANRSGAFVPWSHDGASFNMVKSITSGITVVDFGSEVYFGRITEISDGNGRNVK